MAASTLACWLSMRCVWRANDSTETSALFACVLSAQLASAVFSSEVLSRSVRPCPAKSCFSSFVVRFLLFQKRCSHRGSSVPETSFCDTATHSPANNELRQVVLEPSTSFRTLLRYLILSTLRSAMIMTTVLVSKRQCASSISR